MQKDKGEAMERVCEYYGADLADTVAFGDSMNDWQMPECAGGLPWQWGIPARN